jgi:hypothetical protein
LALGDGVDDLAVVRVARISQRALPQSDIAGGDI